MSLRELFTAIDKGDCVQVGKILHQSPQYIREKSPEGLPLLNTVVINGNIDVLRTICGALKHHNLPLPFDYYNLEDHTMTPLAQACLLDKEVMIKELLRQGAQPNVGTTSETNPLCLAAQTNQKNTVSLLLRYGADPNHAGHRVITPLLHAAQQGNVDVAELLYHAEAKINQQNKYGRTALHEAVFHGHKDMVRFLLDHKADPDRYGDEEKEFPLHTGCKWSHVLR